MKSASSIAIYVARSVMVVFPLVLMETKTNALVTVILKTPKAAPSVLEHVFKDHQHTHAINIYMYERS